MLTVKWLPCLVLGFFWGPASGGNVLIFPADTSHWINMKYIVDELLTRGHQVTVLVPSFFLMINSSEQFPFQLEVITVPFSKAEQEALLGDILEMWINGRTELYFWEFCSKMYNLVVEFIAKYRIACDLIVLNEKLLQKLQLAGFNILVADPLCPCGELVAEKLSLPFVYSYRFSEGNTKERFCGLLPAPPSYVPAAVGGLTDRMSFTERMRNLLLYLLYDVVFHHVLAADWNKYYSDVLGVSRCLPGEALLLAGMATPLPCSQGDSPARDKALLGLCILTCEAVRLHRHGWCSLAVTCGMSGCAAPFPPGLGEDLDAGPCGLGVFTKACCAGEWGSVLGLFVLPLSCGVWSRVPMPGRPTTLCEIMGKAEMWLIRTYWDLEFPRPYLPNFEFVGGLHCQPAKPLPEEMEEFVQSSDEHGIVVFSLGSMVQNLTDEKSNMVALALSQIPQKLILSASPSMEVVSSYEELMDRVLEGVVTVQNNQVIWRYKGKRPETLGPNTRLYDWIPQNDLLGHSKTKAFITHGGTNGIYEAIYHGIPMVGIPMFADQPDNIAHMKAKGMAVELDFHTMTANDLVNALNTIIHNTTYKKNAVRLSQIHHDQPVKPLERAVFWIEFVMRHKGAKHLRPAAHHLTWYQYHSLDVIAFLTGCLAVFIFLAVKCCSFCCHKCGQVIRKTKTE
ncbi:hypothetical protein lerEdw1_017589 [Lerista edwardsae]|nr:hypothetical protein lerEdw1_017589 [Lerista edwardsae]